MGEAYGAAAKSLRFGNGPKKPLDTRDVMKAYGRWAGIYDLAFGRISWAARGQAVAAVNRAAGAEVLEVGVGTGLALPMYAAEKRVTGIDLSTPMLEIARERVAAQRLRNVEGLLEMDAQATEFSDARFDIAVAMFVASVVPDPRALVAELKRVVRPGGTILFVNHFANDRGLLSWVERGMARASSVLGWHPDFRPEHMFGPMDLAAIALKRMRPLGLFSLVEMRN